MTEPKPTPLGPPPPSDAPAADAAPPAEAPPGERRLPFAYARRHGVLVTGLREGRATLVHRRGVRSAVLAEVRRCLQMPLRLEPTDAESFDRMLQQHYEQGSNGAMQTMEDLGEELDLTRVSEELPEPADLLESEDDAPIIRLINALLAEAVKESASDIHIEPYEHRLAVRLRVDGVLREVLEPPRALAPLLTSRVKVMAQLDIAEKRRPQDGRISLRIAGRPVDVRVSTLPAGHGERVVLRLLDKQAGRLDLEHLGMDPQALSVMDRLIHRPHGIILVTGPTGSGKTTTLYAVLTRLNDQTRNIMTVEDPIEYYLDGVGQTQVNTKVELTFARGLRAILRQDPDVVMVGEIRDLETAQIAVQASLTGHLVLSTLHTNSAVGAVTRLRDMGVEPFLVSSTLLGVAAQRLVRVLCPRCKRPRRADEAERRALGWEHASDAMLYTAVGCPECAFRGYRGRTGVFELLEIDEALQTMIHDGAGEHALESHARSRSPSLHEDGLRLVREGITTLEEVLRVSRDLE